MNIYQSKLLTWIFLISVFLTTQTQLRIAGYISIPEIILVFLVVYFFIQSLFFRRIKLDELSKKLIIFWLAIYILLGIGTISGIQTSGWPSNGFYHNLFAFLFIGPFTIFLANILPNKTHELTTLLYRMSIFILLYSIATFLIWKIVGNSDELYFIFQQIQVNRFTALSKNPNQFALGILVVPFVFLHFLEKQQEKETIYGLFLISIASYVIISIGFSTLSTAYTLSIYIPLILLLIISSFLKNKRKFFAPVFLIFSFIFFGSININLSDTKHIQGVQNDSAILEDVNLNQSLPTDIVKTIKWKSSYRINTFLNGIEALKISPIFGFGPGNYSGLERPFSSYESHNTGLDWALSSGILGFIFLLLLVARIARKLISNKHLNLFVLLIAILIFSMFHNIYRHPLIWFYLIFLMKYGQIKTLKE